MKTSNAVSIAAAAALALVLASGTAVSAGKITSRQIAKNAVLAKHIKAGAVGSEELADGAVTGPKLAGGAVTGPKLADGSVTGAKVDEATLSSVPNALSVGGVTVVPVTASIAADTFTTLISTDDLHVFISCQSGTGQASAEFSSPGGFPLTLEAIREGLTSFIDTYPLGSGAQLNASSGHFTATATRPGAGFTQLELTAFYAANAIGSNDCFFRGTLSTTP
jgi:hypothetical protein